MEATHETITETGPAIIAAPIDLAEARARLADLQGQVQAQERAIAEEELRQAEAAHGALLEQCETAQAAFDEINRKVEAQTSVVFQASTRKAGAAQQIDMHRHNRPQGGPRYGDKAPEVWNTDLETFLAEQRAAETAYGEVFAVLLNLQGQRRAAVEALDSQSRPELLARNRVGELRRKFDAMNPQPAKTEWKQQTLNGVTLELSSNNSLRSDPVTRRAATREPADSLR
ncbi:MAG: hypothetical protein ACLP07_16610 [Terracidiphilus sp.]